MSSTKDFETMLAEAEEQLDRGETEAAEELFRQVLEGEPDHTTALNKLGVCRARQDDLEGASELFSRVLEIDPRHVPALSNLGNIHYSNRQYEQAIDLYKRAIAIDPEYGVAHNNLAAAYKKAGRYGEFVSHIKRAQRLAINSPPPLPERGGRGRTGCLGRGALLVLLALLLVYLV